MLFYFGVASVAIAQFVRPTWIGWLILTLLFCFATGETALSPDSGPRNEYFTFLAIVGFPAVALLLSWPRANEV